MHPKRHGDGPPRPQPIIHPKQHNDLIPPQLVQITESKTLIDGRSRQRILAAVGTSKKPVIEVTAGQNEEKQISEVEDAG